MTPNTDPTLHAYFSELGKRGKAAQNKNSTPGERTARAQHAARARWAKQNEARAEQFKRENEKAKRLSSPADQEPERESQTDQESSQ